MSQIENYICLIIYTFIIIVKWLETEALPGNPKIERTSDGKYMFKPPYKLKDRKALLKLLKQQDLKGLGGIMMDDIQESLPNCEKALKVKKINTDYKNCVLYFIYRKDLLMI